MPSTWRMRPMSATGTVGPGDRSRAISTTRWADCSRSDLIILAGRPSMGKTALVTNIAYNVAKRDISLNASPGTDKTVDGGVVGFFSLEMSAEQLATRILSEQAEIGSEKIRRGMISTRMSSASFVAVSQEMPGAAFHRPDGWHFHCPACSARPKAQAPEGPRPADRRLSCSCCRARRRAAAKTASRKSPRSRRASRPWQRNLRCRLSRSRSSRVRWSSREDKRPAAFGPA